MGFKEIYQLEIFLNEQMNFNACQILLLVIGEETSKESMPRTPLPLAMLAALPAVAFSRTASKDPLFS